MTVYESADDCFSATYLLEIRNSDTFHFYFTAMRSQLLFAIHLFLLITFLAGDEESDNCHKNTYVDYDELIETRCTIELCLLGSTWRPETSQRSSCERDFVVRYNISSDHNGSDTKAHFSVIYHRPLEREHTNVR